MTLVPPLPRQVFTALARQFVSRRMFGISNSQLALLASSFASVGHEDDAFTRTITRLASGRTDTLSAPEMATLAWAITSLKTHSSLLMRAATAAAVNHMEELSTLQIANLQAALMATGEIMCSRQLMQAVTRGKSNRKAGEKADQIVFWGVESMQADMHQQEARGA